MRIGCLIRKYFALSGLEVAWSYDTCHLELTTSLTTERKESPIDLLP
jgi:hypothetical protein